MAVSLLDRLAPKKYMYSQSSDFARRLCFIVACSQHYFVGLIALERRGRKRRRRQVCNQFYSTKVGSESRSVIAVAAATLLAWTLFAPSWHKNRH
jgi:hypothetical protein